MVAKSVRFLPARRRRSYLSSVGKLLAAAPENTASITFALITENESKINCTESAIV
jgi:hypothetical protein